MGDQLDIVEAVYGVGESKDVNIQHLFSKGTRLHKTTDLHAIVGHDPYPNRKKYVQVTFTSNTISTKTLHEECLTLREGGTRVGFEGDAFSIDIPDMYEYQVLEASFQILDISVSRLGSCHDKKTLDKERWHHIVSRSDQGYYHVCPMVDASSLTVEGDPFPGEQKIFHVQYRQQAKYRVRVYEIRGKLVKDVVLVEIPKYQWTMMYHFYPKFEHPVMKIHQKYLQKCLQIFDKIVVSIAQERYGNRQDKDVFMKMIGASIDDPRIQFMYVINNRHRGEAVSFMNLVNSIQHLDDHHFLFYAHSKGLTHHEHKRVHSIRQWIELMYTGCLMNMESMIYATASSGGSFKKHCMINGIRNPRWHYSGSFFFLKSSLLYRKAMMMRYAYDYFISERCPGLLCPNAENCLTFFELKPGFDNLYDSKAVSFYSHYLPS